MVAPMVDAQRPVGFANEQEASSNRRELREIMKNSFRMKVTRDNAFKDGKILDHIDELVTLHDDNEEGRGSGEVDFYTASRVVQGASNVYGYRVEAVYDQVLKVIRHIAVTRRAGDAQASGDEDGADEAQTGVSTGKSSNQTREGKTGNLWASTLSTEKKISLEELPAENKCLDAHFVKVSSYFEEATTKGLLLTNLQVNSDLSLQFKGDAPFFPKISFNQADGKEGFPQLDISVIEDILAEYGGIKGSANLEICPELRDLQQEYAVDPSIPPLDDASNLSLSPRANGGNSRRNSSRRRSYPPLDTDASGSRRGSTALSLGDSRNAAESEAGGDEAAFDSLPDGPEDSIRDTAADDDADLLLALPLLPTNALEDFDRFDENLERSELWGEKALAVSSLISSSSSLAARSSSLPYGNRGMSDGDDLSESSLRFESSVGFDDLSTGGSLGIKDLTGKLKSIVRSNLNKSGPLKRKREDFGEDTDSVLDRSKAARKSLFLDVSCVKVTDLLSPDRGFKQLLKAPKKKQKGGYSTAPNYLVASDFTSAIISVTNFSFWSLNLMQHRVFNPQGGFKYTTKEAEWLRRRNSSYAYDDEHEDGVLGGDAGDNSENFDSLNDLVTMGQLGSHLSSLKTTDPSNFGSLLSMGGSPLRGSVLKGAADNLSSAFTSASLAKSRRYVDVSKIKRAISGIVLPLRLNETQELSKEKNNLQIVSYNQGKDFKALVEETIHSLYPNERESCSVHMVFSCLLHMCNEKDLLLEPTNDGSNFYIKHGASENLHL